MIDEPFVSADVAAEFLGIKHRFLLSLARRGIDGAYPLGTGCKRNTWVFLLSELKSAIAARKSATSLIPKLTDRGTIPKGSPR